MDALHQTRPGLKSGELLAFYREVRDTTTRLAAPLSDADATVQSMPDASPAKWHLAHTTWFFETMIACPHVSDYRRFNDAYHYLFNSYYESLGERQPRPQRGMLTRPSLAEVLAYRRHVDEAMERYLCGEPQADAARLLELGCHHEQQHQELLLTDILHLFAQNPLRPAYRAPGPLGVQDRPLPPPSSQAFGGGVVETGHDGVGFAFDCEAPRHHAWLDPYRIADRLVTNREWMDFIADDGYRNPLLWLSAGWARAHEEGWSGPLYWEARDGEFWSMTLRGAQPVDPLAPVTHVSYFEADAFATWAHKRLPTENEWELAAGTTAIRGNFLDSGRLRPQPPTESGSGLKQIYGDVWEWTRSAFLPYPRFKVSEGAVGEYNGKFMSGQYVLRGGSCVTPMNHIRASYRNFFPPEARWQFSGVRLAEDV
ncbi:MAG TPA: ergothioneine biosynthesis protein EgtB [Steroidobacteraceae bacterium]|jgi:ergothioneine biosynthesis protein EgtB|nr:ergothioneine biosynthesis protein EgtB [Steroidobacteraceae bacterium]